MFLNPAFYLLAMWLYFIEVIQNRTALLRTEAKKIEHIIPEAHDAILQKVHLLHHDLQIVKEFDRYKDLLVQIESILQDCENQLKKQYLSKLLKTTPVNFAQVPAIVLPFVTYNYMQIIQIIGGWLQIS